MKYFSTVFILIFSFFASAADWPAISFMSHAQNRLDANTPDGDTCQPGRSCPAFLQSLQREDFESRFAGLGFLDSRAPICQIPVTQSRSPDIVNRFANAAELQQQLARTYPEIGFVNTNAARACAASTGDDASARYRVAKFYMYSKRLNDGATRAVEEISAINSLLGENNQLECRGNGSITQAFRRCQAIKASCANGASQLATIAAASASDEERFKAIQEQMQQLRRGCLAREADYEQFAADVTQANPSHERCTQLFIERGVAPRRICRTYTWQEKQRMLQCNQALVSLQIAEGALADKNPWFKSANYFELRRTKSVAESIRLQSLSNRTELKKKLLEYEAAALCVNGGSSASSCDTDQVRAVLAATPEIPESFSGDRKANAATLYLGAQSCIEEAVRDQAATASLLRGLAGDAALTVATAGLSGFAIAGRSAVAVSRGARIAGVAALSIDGFYASQSYAAVVRACSSQVNKIAIAMRADPQTQCPGPQSNASQAQREYSNCAASAAFAALDSLPFVPLIPKIRNEVAARNARVRAPTAATASGAEVPGSVERLRRLSSDDARVDQSVDRYMNRDLARATVTRRIDTRNVQSVTVDGRKFEGQSNNGLELITFNGQPGFVKVTDYRAGDNTRKLRDELFYTEMLGREGMGPRFLGSYIGSDGYLRQATEFIEGTHVHIGFIPEEIAGISAASIDQMESMTKRLLDAGINPGDLQFRVNPQGRPYIIDTANFERLDPADYQYYLNLYVDDYNRLREARGLIPRGTTERIIRERATTRRPHSAPAVTRPNP